MRHAPSVVTAIRQPSKIRHTAEITRKTIGRRSHHGTATGQDANPDSSNSMTAPGGESGRFRSFCRVIRCASLGSSAKAAHSLPMSITLSAPRFISRSTMTMSPTSTIPTTSKGFAMPATATRHPSRIKGFVRKHFGASTLTGVGGQISRLGRSATGVQPRAHRRSKRFFSW